MPKTIQHYTYISGYTKLNLQKGKAQNPGHQPFLLDFLAWRFPYLPKERWLALILQGKIQVNNQLVEPNFPLKNKAVISYEREIEDEPTVDKDFKIIFEDKNILVVEKGGNLPVSESGRYWWNTLLSFLRDDFGYEKLYPVHRIDKETSGLVVIAKDKNSAFGLGNIFANKQHNKLYHAVLKGSLEKEIWVHQPMKKNEGESTVHIRQICSADGKSAKSFFFPLVLEKDFSFVSVQTFTGRTHQIRVHAEFLQHPLLGDKLYGNPDAYFLERIKNKNNPNPDEKNLASRHLLHASFLSFPHPVSNQILKFYSAPLPFFQKSSPMEKIFLHSLAEIEAKTAQPSALSFVEEQQLTT